MQHEASNFSVPRLFIAGLPALLAYHVCDFVLPVAGQVILNIGDDLLPPGLPAL